MAEVRITFLGSGDAFGSGGRFHACFLVEAGASRFLVDCGASAPVAIQRCGLDVDGVSLILLSHLHGDHFGGLPFLLLDAQFGRRRTRPLVVAGPPGTRRRLADAMEALFPGSWEMPLRFPLEITELEPERPHRLGEVTVTPYVVEHACGAPPFALRIECGGKVFAYTGDTEWTDTLIPAARGADLLIAECNQYDRKVRFHLDLPTLAAHRDALQAKRLIVTHMGPAVLAHLGALSFEHAEDGMVVTL